MFEDLIKERFSVRNYSDRPVEDEKLEKILEAGRVAPTAANKQPQKVYVLKSEEAMKKAREFTRMMYNAPMALLIAYDDKESWKANAFGDPDYDGGEVDAAIVTTHMMLEAAEQGLGSLWARGWPSEKAREYFDLPENIHPVAFLLLGYPADNLKPNPRHTDRKELSETVEIW